jgi:hypothetical protein
MITDQALRVIVIVIVAIRNFPVVISMHGIWRRKVIGVCQSLCHWTSTDMTG